MENARGRQGLHFWSAQGSLSLKRGGRGLHFWSVQGRLSALGVAMGKDEMSN
jgi:hypothetical protein